jgi:predicted protein tyrosine phosphatase
MVRSLVPFDVTICGIPELDKFRDARVSHVLSIIDPQEPEPDAFRFYPSHERLTLRFDDIVASYPGFQAPGRDDVKKLLDFGQSLDSAGREGHLLVHCHAGISRSTAATAILLAQPNPGREREAFLALLDLRNHAWPNTRMVEFADDLLGRNGTLLTGLEAYRRALLERKPHLAEIIRNIGRGNELPQ